MTTSAKAEQACCFGHAIAGGALCRVAESFGDGVLQALRSSFVVETALVFIALGLLLGH